MPCNTAPLQKFKKPAWLKDDDMKLVGDSQNHATGKKKMAGASHFVKTAVKNSKKPQLTQLVGDSRLHKAESDKRQLVGDSQLQKRAGASHLKTAKTTHLVGDSQVMQSAY